MIKMIYSRYTKTDIEQGLQYLKVGIMNALADIESGAKNRVTLDGPIALSLIVRCAEERGWRKDPFIEDWYNGWEVDYWYPMIDPNNKRIFIGGSLLNCTYVTLERDED